MMIFEFTEHGREKGLETIAKTFSLSFEWIRSNNQRAADLLCPISCFQHQEIPRCLLTENDEGTNQEQIEDGFAEAVDVLRTYSLVDVDDAGDIFSTHRLVQFTTRCWLSREELGRWSFMALNSVAQRFPFLTWRSPEYLATCSALLPHAELLLITEQSSMPSEHNAELERSRLLLRTGLYMGYTGSLSQGLARIEDAFNLRKRQLGERDYDTLENMKVLVNLLIVNSDFERAIGLGRRLLPLSTDILGPDHRVTIAALAILTAALGESGEYEESEILLRDALSRSTQIFGQ